MLKRKKGLIKKITIVAIPIVFFGVLSCATLWSRSKANESAFAHEQYYNEEESEESSLDSKEDISMDESVETITSNDEVALDTNPNSITVLVNKELGLPKDFVPEDLVVPDVLFTINYFDEKKQLRSEAAKALETLFAAATKDNYTLYGVSGYRSYTRQYSIFTTNIKKKGLEHTMQYSAKPGYSEHQTGLAIDVSAKSVNNRLDSSFGDTAEGKWLAENAYLYGFVIRYPDGKSDITGYSYEPWHIRYVGKSLAKYLYKNDLCLEEYYKFTPIEDYSDEISYDNLADYGIDLDDVISKPTAAPTVTPRPVTEEEDTSEETAEETNTKEDTKEENTADETAPGKKPTVTPKPGKTPTVTPAPTKVPTPTKAPTPTAKPTLTPTPVPAQGETSEDGSESTDIVNSVEY